MWKVLNLRHTETLRWQKYYSTHILRRHLTANTSVICIYIKGDLLCIFVGLHFEFRALLECFHDQYFFKDQFNSYWPWAPNCQTNYTLNSSDTSVHVWAKGCSTGKVTKTCCKRSVQRTFDLQGACCCMFTTSFGTRQCWTRISKSIRISENHKKHNMSPLSILFISWIIKTNWNFTVTQWNWTMEMLISIVVNDHYVTLTCDHYLLSK